MIREINIKPVLNGFICKVGCQTVVFTSVKDLVRGIEEYYNHPEETEQRFVAAAVNKTMDNGPLAAEPCCGGESLCEAPSPRPATRGDTASLRSRV